MDGWWVEAVRFGRAGASGASEHAVETAPFMPEIAFASDEHAPPPSSSTDLHAFR